MNYLIVLSLGVSLITWSWQPLQTQSSKFIDLYRMGRILHLQHLMNALSKFPGLYLPKPDHLTEVAVSKAFLALTCLWNTWLCCLYVRMSGDAVHSSHRSHKLECFSIIQHQLENEWNIWCVCVSAFCSQLTRVYIMKNSSNMYYACYYVC